MTVFEILGAVARRWFLVMVFLAIGAGTGYGLSQLQPTTYVAQATVYVTSRLGQQLGQERVKSYAVVPRSGPVLDNVVRQGYLPYDQNALRQRVEVTVPAETALIEISATDEQPVRAAQVANALAEQLKAAVFRLERGSQSPVDIETIEPAQPPGSAATPQTKANIALGVLVGAFASVGLVLVGRVKGES